MLALTTKEMPRAAVGRKGDTLWVQLRTAEKLAWDFFLGILICTALAPSDVPPGNHAENDCSMQGMKIRCIHLGVGT